MSDHEFNNYLTLLAGLLRLGDKQRRAIAEELRGHLEDRLEELLARGMPREEAIQRALAEFGDAAGLAAQFTSISRGRRRRWLMRTISFSIAATVLIAAGLAIFWPGRNAGPGMATVVAQAPQPATEETPVVPEQTKPRIAEVLARTMDFKHTEVPLKDFLFLLMDQTGVTFRLNTKTLNDAGINPDTPVTFHARGMRLRTALDLMLKELDLTYIEHEELIIVTTPDEAESQLATRIYDCRDLLGWATVEPVKKGAIRPAPSDSSLTDDSSSAVTNPQTPKAAGKAPAGAPKQMTEHDERAQRLMNIISACCDADSWDEVGGPGSISDYYGLFIISQTDSTHRKIEQFLEKLREAAGIDEPQPVRPKVVR